MTVATTLAAIAILFAPLALIGFASTVGALRRRRPFGAAMTGISSLLMLSLAALFGTLSASIRGYRALTREEVAAVVEVQPADSQKFTARFTLAKDKPVDMFHRRRRFEMLNPLVDAEYGSATFVGSGKPATFRILVSTTGLLIRKAAPDSGR